MKALSVKPEYAASIARGEKSIELRSWPTRHRGPLLICATRPAGVMVCVVDVVDCRPFAPADATAACSAYRPGLYAWVLADARPVAPVRVRGRQRLFDVADGLVREVSGPARVRSPQPTGGAS